jgi:hypothetical protein
MSAAGVDLDPVTNLPVDEGAASSSSNAKPVRDVEMVAADAGGLLDGQAEIGSGLADQANGNSSNAKRKVLTHGSITCFCHDESTSFQRIMRLLPLSIPRCIGHLAVPGKV